MKYTSTRSSLLKGGEKMRVILFIAIGVLLATAAFGANYTQVFYPNTDGTAGENWFSMKTVPFNPDPSVFFGDSNLIEGILVRLDAPNQSQFPWSEYIDGFGGMLLGDGYICVNQTGANYTISYTGVVDGLGTESTVAEGTKVSSMTDMWISLPGKTGSDGGEHWIGFPFNHNVEFSTLKVTDGETTIPVMDAINLGWIENYWTTLDNQNQSQYVVDPEGYAGPTYLEPGHMYILYTHKANLALIIPAGDDYVVSNN